MAGVIVGLSATEYHALARCVSGELDSLTQADWESGVYDDLADAQRALIAAWKRRVAIAARKRTKKRVPGQAA